MLSLVRTGGPAKTAAALTQVIPVSLIGTFAAFYALGFTINIMSMFALVLAIGLARRSAGPGTSR